MQVEKMGLKITAFRVYKLTMCNNIFSIKTVIVMFVLMSCPFLGDCMQRFTAEGSSCVRLSGE